MNKLDMFYERMSDIIKKELSKLEDAKGSIRVILAGRGVSDDPEYVIKQSVRLTCIEENKYALGKVLMELDNVYKTIEVIKQNYIEEEK